MIFDSGKESSRLANTQSQKVHCPMLFIGLKYM